MAQPGCSDGRFLTATLYGILLGGILLGVSLFTLPGPSPARAQDAGLRPLMDRMGRLERDINLLQRQVYAGKQGVAKGVPATLEAGPQKNIAARMEVRFGELEDELRGVTGRFEELSHQIEQLNQRLDLLSGDLDLRLNALEGGTPLAQGESGARGEGMGPEGAVPAGEAAMVGEGSLPQGVGLLGVMRVPSGSEEPGGELQGATGAPAAATATPGQAGGETVQVTQEVEVAVLPEGTPKEQYDYSTGLLWQSDYAGAERALRAFLKAHPDDDLAANAQYWLGETFYVRKDFANAAVIFAEGFEKYPNSPKAPDNLLKLGLALVNIDETEQACKALAELGKRFPDAPESLINRAQKERQEIGCP